MAHISLHLSNHLHLPRSSPRPYTPEWRELRHSWLANSHAPSRPTSRTLPHPGRGTQALKRSGGTSCTASSGLPWGWRRGWGGTCPRRTATGCGLPASTPRACWTLRGGSPRVPGKSAKKTGAVRRSPSPLSSISFSEGARGLRFDL